MKLDQVKFEDVNGKQHRRYVTQRAGATAYTALDTYSNVVMGTFPTSQDSQQYLIETDESVMLAERVRIQSQIK
jgi:hypothetical protein